jgi:hypothetical protein
MTVAVEFQSGQLFWWRESPQLHTLITLWGYPLAVTSEADSFRLNFKLFDTNGELQTTWHETLTAQGCLFLDSAQCSTTQGLKISEGVLALTITTNTDQQVAVPAGALYSIIDWYSEESQIMSLHNDQLMRAKAKLTKWTEIVVHETIETRNSLVVINGAESQPQQSISLEIKNYLGETCPAIYHPAIVPFSLHQLRLAELFPNIIDFCQNQPITVTGTFASHGVFVRPYVVTEGQSLGAYHGGNHYSWENLPAISYKFMGQGEVNPMVVVHQDQLTTTINLLNTHAELEEDFWVDIDLYDCAGTLVSQKQRWLLARRNQLCRAEIADLLPDVTVPFTGHVALRFSDDRQQEYPRRLQALMEYRTPHSVARVMAWSDVWNWHERSRSSPPIDYLAYYRVWWKFPFTSYISLTNCGIDADYDRTATYRIRLENGRGDYLVCEGTIPPQGTLYKATHELFPAIAEFLGDQPVGLVVLETPADLASMHLTHHQGSGVYAAEHFLPVYIRHDGDLYSPCGS